MSAQPASRDDARLEIQVDSQWAAVSKKGRGVTVRVLRVTPVNVMFRAIGSGRERGDTFTLARKAFELRYSPIHAIPDRQRALRLQELREGPPVPDGTPYVDDEASDGAVAVEDLLQPVEPPPPPPPPEELRPGTQGRPSNLTRTQAREIYELRGGGSSVEVAELYGVTDNVVKSIWRRDSYRWATEGLEEHPRRLRPTPPTPTLVVPEHALPPSPAPATKTEEVSAVISQPARTVVSRVESPPRTDALTQELLTDLADGLQVLLSFVGQPLPKYIILDRPKLESLIEQARKAAR